MKEYGTNKIRNIGVFSHARAGKTSLAEALLFCAGATDKLGKVDDGTTVSDYDEEEIQRKTSINSSLCVCEYNGHKINIIDTPGYSDFRGEQESTLRVVDVVLFVVDASMGVEAGTEKAWFRTDDYNKPRFIFVNKIEREMAKFDDTLSALEALGSKIVPLNLPIGIGTSFSGLVDLIKMKAYDFQGDKGEKVIEGEIPEELMEKAKKWKEKMVEKIAETGGKRPQTPPSRT